MNSTFATIGIIIVHTPLWVWVLYALLLFLGFQRTRDSSVPLWRMLILPAIVTLLAVLGALSAGVSGLPALFAGLIVGGVAGWWLERDGGTSRLPDGRLLLRGEWWSMGQIVLVLVFRYAINVVAAMDPLLNADPTWHISSVFISAALSATFLGRTAARLRVYFAAPIATRA